MGAASKAREARIRPYSTAEQRRWQCPAAAESGELFRRRSLGRLRVDRENLPVVRRLHAIIAFAHQANCAVGFNGLLNRPPA
ncbi:MAG: hypothetical protein ACI9W2_001360 [Gammaproteobacteria bacterium]|jgi:hypothetical protein